MRPPTVRHKMLIFLRRRPEASAADIAHALNLSGATVRHHLTILCADGRAIRVGRRRGSKRGRPVQLYRLADMLLGDNLAIIADGLLGAFERLPKAPNGEDPATILASRLNDQMGPGERDAPPAKRLTSLTQRLDSAHYNARWEAGADGPRVLFGHCPYAAIIAKHPELCQMDAHMLALQMGMGATQVAKIAPGPGGPTHCIFVLR